MGRLRVIAIVFMACLLAFYGFVMVSKKQGSKPQEKDRFAVRTEQINGQNQVFLDDKISKKSLQLSFFGVNSGPKLEKNRVVWQRQIENSSAILYFDGTGVRKINGNYAATHPFIKDNQIIYAQQVKDNLWQTVLYNIETGQSKVIAEGTASKAGWPRFEGDTIKTTLEGSAKYYY